MNIEDSSAETLLIMFALNYDNKKILEINWSLLRPCINEIFYVFCTY